MKRIVHSLIMMLVMMLLCWSASAESVWVEETWEHVSRELDCDGLPMTVNADVLAVTPGTTVREYQTVKQTNAFARDAVASIDWEALDFDTSIQQTVSDDILYYYNGNPHSEKVGSDYSYGAGFYDLHVRYNAMPYGYVDDMLYELDTSDFGALTWEGIMKRAESAAEVLNIQIGQPRSMKRTESYKAADAYWELNLPYLSQFGYTEEDLEQGGTIEVFMPAYYQGMRLYSGEQVGLPGESRMLEPLFSLRLDRDGWLVSMYCPLFNGWTPKGEEATPLTFEDALENLRQAYANMYLPNVAGIAVHEAALEYVLMSSDFVARDGFTAYPTWVFQMNLKYDGEEEGDMEYVGIHAITGEKIF